MTIKKFFAAGSAVLAACAVSSAASASVTITGISSDPGFLTGRISYQPGGIGGSGGPTSETVYIGRLKLSGVDNTTGASVTFDSYCIDILNTMQKGTFDLRTFTLGNGVKDDQIKRLLSGTSGFIGAATGSAAKKDVSAAIQMAVWEIVNESSATYSLGNGIFRVGTTGTVNPNARTLAQGYLDNLGSFSETGTHRYRMLEAVAPTTNQRQIFLAAIPEPATWAMLILGFGVVGGAMRGRRGRHAVVYA